MKNIPWLSADILVNREFKKSKNNIMLNILQAVLIIQKKTWDGIREIVNLKKKTHKNNTIEYCWENN